MLGSLWVRYLGSRVVHRAELFPIPTNENPQRVAALVRRGDVAEVYYVCGEEWDPRHHYRLFPEVDG